MSSCLYIVHRWLVPETRDFPILGTPVAGEIIPRSFWKSDTSSASQDTPWILWKQTVYYHVRNGKPPVPILSDINAYPAKVENMASS